MCTTVYVLNASEVRLWKHCELHGLCLPEVKRAQAVAASRGMFVLEGKRTQVLNVLRPSQVYIYY